MYFPPLRQQTYPVAFLSPPAASSSPPSPVAFSSSQETSFGCSDHHDPLLPYPSSPELPDAGWAGLSNKIRTIKCDWRRSQNRPSKGEYKRRHLYVHEQCSNLAGGGLQTCLVCSSVGLCSVCLRIFPWSWPCPPAWSGWWDSASYSAPPAIKGTFRGKISTSQ